MPPGPVPDLEKSKAEKNLGMTKVGLQFEKDHPCRSLNLMEHEPLKGKVARMKASIKHTKGRRKTIGITLPESKAGATAPYFVVSDETIPVSKAV